MYSIHIYNIHAYLSVPPTPHSPTPTLHPPPPNPSFREGECIEYKLTGLQDNIIFQFILSIYCLLFNSYT